MKEKEQNKQKMNSEDKDHAGSRKKKIKLLEK